MKISACIEWLFADEKPQFADRIRAAKAAGVDAIEFWMWSNKDLPALKTALAETKMVVSGFVAEPMVPLTNPANRTRFLDGLAKSAELAKELGSRILIAQAGNDLVELSRKAQRDSLTKTLAEAGKFLSGSGVILAVEPLNTLIDHVGYFLPSTKEGLDIVDDTGRPEIKIVYDVYHSAVMGEKTEDVIVDRIDRVAHVHIADHPGRQEPGSGKVDLRARYETLRRLGYAGAVGLEYRPSRSTRETLKGLQAW